MTHPFIFFNVTIYIFIIVHLIRYRMLALLFLLALTLNFNYSYIMYISPVQCYSIVNLNSFSPLLVRILLPCVIEFLCSIFLFDLLEVTLAFSGIDIYLFGIDYWKIIMFS